VRLSLVTNKGYLLTYLLTYLFSWRAGAASRGTGCLPDQYKQARHIRCLTIWPLLVRRVYENPPEEPCVTPWRSFEVIAINMDRSGTYVTSY